MERFDIEAAVVGAGVVGLAVARRLALDGREVMVLEKNAHFGEETSSRNSEVIHAGLYYPPGSLKGALCVEGKRALYAFCAERGVPHRNVQKLIVACEESELAGLDGVIASAVANGVSDLRRLTRAEALALEPALDVAGAALSPSTGIVDSHAYMLALIGEAEAHGASVVYGAGVAGGTLMADGRIALRVDSDPPVEIRARHVVNAAGLWAPAVARAIEGIDPTSVPRQRLAKGCYFALAGRAPFTRLIYPLPGGGGLGVHLTLDLSGRGKFGPDVEWLPKDATPATVDYSVPPERGASFYAAVRRYWPGLPDGALSADYAGLRAKLSAPGEPAADFRIDGAERHGAPGHAMLYGVESPGLTASLAIADRVTALVAA